MVRRMPWVAIVLAGAVAGCDFPAALEKCRDAGRCPDASSGPTPDDSSGWCGFDAGVVFLGPTPYAGRVDSPFRSCPDASTFYFDDFEQGTINLPGVTVMLPSTPEKDGGLRRGGSSLAIDSVDEDDGVIDGGRCVWPDGGACAALYSPNGPEGITLEWEASALPQFVGLAWTDGRLSIRFEAFGADQESLGVIGPTAGIGFPDAQQEGSTAEDRFFGVVAPGGVSKVRISCTDGGMEIDHVQYGRWSPPGS